MWLGIVVRSGLYDVLKRLLRKGKQLSRKERRALTLASVAWLVYMAMFCVPMLLPWNFMLGVTGSWLHSPLAEGFVYILSMGVGLTGMVYGYVSDAFHGLVDVVEGMSWLIARGASYWVALFFIVQFFSFLEYTRLAEWLGIDGGLLDIVCQLFCFLSLFVYWVRSDNR